MAEVSSSAAKACAACKKDVSNLPRTKDAQGRYFCKECVAKLKTKAAGPKPVEQDAVMAKLLADAPAMELCPNCGGGISGSAKICIRCGFNKETGKAMRVQVEMAKKEKGESALSKVGAAAEGPMSLVFALIGAVIGGGIGGAMWYGLAMGAGLELWLLAWLVGAITGAGAAAGARRYMGTYSGLIAAAVALISIVGAKWIVVDTIVNEFSPKTARSGVRATEENGVAIVARDVLAEEKAQGRNYQMATPPDQAITEEEFPTPVWTEAKQRYEGLDEAGKQAKLAVASSQLTREIKDENSELKDDIMAWVLFRPRSLIGMLLGVITAFAVGSGSKSIGESFHG